jgi:site-specific recombinase XerD
MAGLQLREVPAPSGEGRARNPYWTYLARLDSGASRMNVQGHLDRIARILLPAGAGLGDCAGELVPWGALRYEHTSMLRAVLVARYDAQVWKASTVNAHLSALRGVINEAWKLGHIDAEELKRATSIENVSVHRVPAGRHIHADEVAAMLSAGAGSDDEPGPLMIRDTAVIAWLWSTGGRRAEAAAQLIEHYDRRQRSVQIFGKGNKQRIGFLHPAAAAYVGNWLAVLNQRRGPMFRRVDRWGNIGSGPITPRAIGLIVERRRRMAGLDPLSAHDWRRTFVGDLLTSGADIVQVQMLAGHASPATTALYDNRPELQRRDAVDKRAMPGGGTSG